MTWLSIAAETISTAASLALAFALLSLHNTIRDQTQIDPKVVAQLNQEERIVIVAIILIGISYLLKLIDGIREEYNALRQRQVHQKLTTGKVQEGAWNIKSKLAKAQSKLSRKK